MPRVFFPAFVWLCLASPAAAQPQAPAATGAVEGAITTQSGTIALGGALVIVRDGSGWEVARLLSEGDGRYRAGGLPPGRYRVGVSLDGFSPSEAVVVVAAGATASASVDLPLAALAERVEVVAQAPLNSTDTLNRTQTIDSREVNQFSAGGGVGGALRLIASVVQMPGGASIKGGRPAQAGVQLGASSLADPVTGLSHVNLPDDAVDSVSVLPNPYAVEYGRFSSGLVVIRTRRAGDAWKLRLNNLDPTFRTARQKDWKVKGIAAFGPRIEVGGPLVKNRLYLEQTAQYRYSASDVPSRPEDELRETQWLSSFTRLDAELTPKHALVGTVGVFPRATDMASLGTFTPPDATVDTRERVDYAAVSERAAWSDTLLSEMTVHVHRSDTRVAGRGQKPMELLPDTTAGHFFNRQSRTTAAYQAIGSISGSAAGWGGTHLYKVGVDLLRGRYEGTSDSRPVLVRRADGTLVRRLEFGPPTRQNVGSTDLALFAQDRLQVTPRWLVEYGARLDRDGVLGRTNLTPRIGSAVSLNASGSAVLHGGFGLFYERTPLLVGAFEQFEAATDTRYAADGVTALGPPVRFAHVMAPGLGTPRSVTWDVGYDHRFSEHWSIHAGVLDRRGSHELVLDPVRLGGPGGELRLSDGGRSVYREAEVGFQFTHLPLADLNVSYARASARSDLNAFTTFFDSQLRPIIGGNQYAAAPTDVPHRLFARGRVMPTSRWLVLGILDWRTGVPYSIVDESLEFVGRRHDRRFPAYVWAELGLEHRFTWIKWKPWIGVRVNNALNRFLPTDVQGNLGSPAFGSFYNSEYRQIRLQLRFE